MVLIANLLSSHNKNQYCPPPMPLPMTIANIVVIATVPIFQYNRKLVVCGTYLYVYFSHSKWTNLLGSRPAHHHLVLRSCLPN